LQPQFAELCLILPLYPSVLQIDDAAIQVYKDGDYGAYLDLESSLAEQTEEIEGLQARWVKERPQDVMCQHIVISHFEVLA